MKVARIFPILAFGILSCHVVGAPGDGTESASKEKLFSTLAIKFLKYVEWNGVSKVDAGDRLILGVYDKTRNREYFKEFEQLCADHPEAYQLHDLSDESVSDTDLDFVYIAVGSGRLPLELLASFANKPTLVFGEHEKILESGGIVRFEVSAKKSAEYSINLKQARTSGLGISSRLSRGALRLIK